MAGALSGTDVRLALWGLAVLATYAGVTALHWLPGRGRRIDLEHTEIAAGHLIERFRLFFIIVLGEAVLTMGTAFADAPFGLERLCAGDRVHGGRRPLVVLLPARRRARDGDRRRRR